MRIAIDGQLLIGNRTGMGMYAFSILKHWDSKEDSIIIYVPGHSQKDLDELAKRKGFQICVLKKSNYFFWEQILLPHAARIDKVDVILCPYCTAPVVSPCPIVLVIHDTIYMETKLRTVPTIYKKMGLLYRRFIVPFVAKKAVKIVTVSEHSRKQVSYHFPELIRKISVIPNGVDSEKGLRESERILFFKKNNIVKNYILGFGSLEPRKNTITLIKAYERLDENFKKKYMLVLFGFRGYEKSVEKTYIESHELDKAITVLEYITNQEKKSLFENGSVFVFPSLSEGFGIPILEAFESNVPVITSNSASMPEVAGKAALLVNPTDVNEITDSIETILKNTEIANMLIAKGNTRVKQYSSKNTSEKMQILLHNCLIN